MNTTRKQPPLPASLADMLGRALTPEFRRALGTLQADGRSRLIFGLADGGQRVPHVGVLLASHSIAGWVLETGWDHDTDDVGQVCARHMQTFLQHPAFKGLKAPLQGSSGSLPLLCECTTTLEPASTEYDDVRRRTRRQWSRSLCEQLTYSLGMIEVLTLDDPRGFIDKKGQRAHHAQALLPEKDGSLPEWEAVTLLDARYRAQHELERRPFWTLPWQTTTHVVDDIHFSLRSMSPYLRLGGIDGAFTTGLIEISSTHQHPKRGQLALTFKRSYADQRWYGSLTCDGRVADVKTYSIVDGHTALQMAELIMMSGTMPEAASHEDNAQALAAFDRLHHDAHEKQRRLQFVCDALNLTPPR